MPKQNELGFFEIRLESIGGLGANLAGKMLAEAGVVGVGFNGVSFSSYGSEKKGSPVKAHIRFCDMDTHIRDTSPGGDVRMSSAFFMKTCPRPSMSSAEFMKTASCSSTRPKSPEELKEKLKLIGGTIAVVDATGIALEEKNRVNMAMLGALFRLCEFLDFEFMKGIIRKSLGEKISRRLFEPALTTFQRGYDEVQFHAFRAAGRGDHAAISSAGILPLGYETQPMGGTITNPGNSILEGSEYFPRGHDAAFR